jgi:hypothetical protein
LEGIIRESQEVILESVTAITLTKEPLLKLEKRGKISGKKNQ